MKNPMAFSFGEMMSNPKILPEMLFHFDAKISGWIVRYS